MKSLTKRVVLSNVLFFCISAPVKADFEDYLTACMMGMAGGLAGAGVAASSLEEGQTMNSSSYLIAGGITCMASMALKGAMTPQAKFEAEFDIRKNNDFLTFNLKRLSKEKCLLNNTCKPGGNAILMDSEAEIRKQGGSVFTTTTTTNEPND
jgi:hypothetical protein